jgi:hypothetical protein
MATMMAERSMSGMAMGMPGMMGMGNMQPAAAAPMNMTMVPRCTMTFEKCTGGMKIHCVCEDAMSTSMMQNLCSMLAGGMCSCCMMMNGMMVCTCNLTMGMCKCEMTEDGCCFTCTSGDKACCDMIQSLCACMMSMMKAGCSCCMMMNNMPVCYAC